MRVIAYIEDEQLLKKILNHLGLWDVKRRQTPRANSPPIESFIILDESSTPSAGDYIVDADRSTLRLSTGYSMETCL
jgi:hypothetical protein